MLSVQPAACWLHNPDMLWLPVSVKTHELTIIRARRRDFHLPGQALEDELCGRTFRHQLSFQLLC